MGRRVFTKYTDECPLVHSSKTVEYKDSSANWIDRAQPTITIKVVVLIMYCGDVFVGNILSNQNIVF
jgi:hypothetical protein